MTIVPLVAVAPAVIALIVAIAPAIIWGIILIIGLEEVKSIAYIIRDITTNYEYEEEIAIDPNTGEVLYDAEGNPIVITRTSRTSNIGDWLPWIQNIVIILAVAFVAVYLVPTLLTSKGRKGRR